MTSDRAKGRGKEAIGGIKEKVGRVTGDEELEAEGVGEKIEGKAQKAVGKLKNKVHELKEKVT